MVRELTSVIEARFSAPLLRFVREAGGLAAQRGERLYLVGGIVRDLLMGLPAPDVDLVLEGDVGSFVGALREARLGAPLSHSQFETAKLEVEGKTVDIARARTETYSHPSALPQVAPSTLEADLLRRDFSINALAASVLSEDFGRVVDVCDGLEDLEKKQVRALHEKSFQDDATRILRAVRLEQRLGFLLEERTQEWLVRDASYLDTISGDRLRHELERLWQEQAPELTLSRLDDLHVLPALYPALAWDRALAASFARARLGTPSDLSLSAVYLALLGCRILQSQAEGLIARLNLPQGETRAVRDAARLDAVLRDIVERQPSPAAFVEELEEFSPEALWAWALTAPAETAVRLRRLVRDLRHLRPALRGTDLMELGVPPGPAVGEYLRRLRAALLDGQARTLEEERQLVLRWLATGKGV
ncbi:MAG: CCA tRNA nucleotidyltransferase [Chloroflexi bacterium]|nr:CCA tRNA nucleotidyltransferase [Chloroflexota bacterium]